MSPTDDSTPLERMESALNSPYPADGDIWGAFLEAFAAEFRELEKARQDILAAKFVTDASGAQLERLATIFDVERRTGEPEEKFRLRVQTALRAQLSSGTVPDIREAVAVLLDTDTEDVVVSEPDDIDEPRVDIGVWSQQLDDRELSIEEFFEEVEPLTAGGVGVEGFARGTFQFTSEDEPVESDRGFALLNEDEDGPVEGTGGTWPTLLSPDSD